MALFTPNRDYRIPDENAVPPESGTEAFMHLKGAVTAIDFDIAAIVEILTQKAALNHNHTISEVEGLSGELAGKMAANKTFNLDDMEDVDGASQAPVGYVLVKTATGWLPQSALAAVGNHEHTVAQVVGLGESLDLKQGISEKGVANGYPSLGADTKIPLSQLPATTTTATVGAALAGANGKATPADGDRFTGILSGVSTVFWTTWGNIKAGLKAYFDTFYVDKSGDTLTGSLVFGGGSLQPTGDIRAIRSAAPTTGVLYLGNGGRYLYFDGSKYQMPTSPLVVPSVETTAMRISSAANYLSFEDTSNGQTRSIHHNDGYIGFLDSGGAWAMRVNDAGQLWTSQVGIFTDWVEGRGAAHQNAAVNRSVTAARMAGYVEAALTSSPAVVFTNSGYVVTMGKNTGGGAITLGARQPQLYIANIGWFAAFPF